MMESLPPVVVDLGGTEGTAAEEEGVVVLVAAAAVAAEDELGILDVMLLNCGA